MYAQVTIVPSDAFIKVEGAGLFIPNLTSPANVHAIQWHDGTGHIEYTNGAPNRTLTEADYETEVAPFAALWQAEKDRLEEEANRPPTLEEARENAITKLMQKRLAVEYAGPLIEVEGRLIRFPSEVKDETRLNSLAGLFALDPEMQIQDWKVADGVYVTMTAPLLQAVKTAGFAHIAVCFSIERVKREQVEALASADTVAAWVESELAAGWPA